MTWTNKDIYFETSAVNHMAGMFSWKDAVATKERQTEKGNRYYLSPVTIWEILLTSNHQQRENLLFYCQHLFHEELVAGPSELIVGYIKNGCPLVEKQGDFASKLPMATVWKNLVEDKRKTFVFDHQTLTLKTKLLRDTSKEMAKLIMPVAVGESTKDAHLEAIAELIRIYSKQEDFASQKPKDVIRRLALLFITYILCLEADLDSSPVNNFWINLNLHTMLDRVFYVVEELEILTRRGPFIQMALMAYCQTFAIGVRPSRGLFLDCLHSIYFTYMDVFLTQDEHFRSLRDAVAPNPLYKKKIFLFDELQINTEERYVPDPEEDR
jgi:hypothetical protein